MGYRLPEILARCVYGSILADRMQLFPLDDLGIPRIVGGGEVFVVIPALEVDGVAGTRRENRIGTRPDPRTLR